MGALAAALGLALAAPAAAASVPPPAAPRWTASAFVQAALSAAPGARSAQASYDASSARAAARWARAFAPSVTFTGQVTPAKLAPGPLFTFPAWRPSSNGVQLTPGVAWNLFNSGQDRLAARSTELSRENAGQDLEAARQSAALDALNAFWGLFLQEKVLAVARQSLAIQQEVYALTQDRYQHGMKSLSELLKTETDWRSAELLSETNEAQRRQALFNFNVLIGAEEGAEAPLDADLQLGTTVPPRLEDGLREAMERRPELLKERGTLEQSLIALRLARIEAGPTMSLDFTGSDTWQGAYGGRAARFGGPNALYGFALRLALPASFNGYSQLQDVRAARADLRQAEAGAETLRRQVRLEVYQAHIDLSRALRAYEIASRKEDISRQTFDIVKEAYSEGSQDVIFLSQAQTDYVTSQTERLQALHDVKIDTALWKKAIGEPIWH